MGHRYLHDRPFEVMDRSGRMGEVWLYDLDCVGLSGRLSDIGTVQ